jgi:acetyl esterase/lipase
LLLAECAQSATPRSNGASGFQRRKVNSYMTAFPRLAAASIAAASIGIAGMLAASPPAMAQSGLAPRDVPARSIPVPDTVSPQMQKIIAAPLNPTWNRIPKTPEEWKARSLAESATAAASLPGLRARMHVTVQPQTIDGVKVFVVTPDVIPPENHNRLLIHVHGGCYVFGGGEAATTEAIFMAGFGHFKVISVDYRMPPEAYFPGALDDAMTVYKAALKMAKPQNMAIFGTSAGGALTLEMILRAKQLGLPLPAAIAAGTPMADLTKSGDSFRTNEMVDNVLVSPDGRCHAAAEFYAGDNDLKDPLLSPIYGDLHGFPPTVLTTGTRDLLLSNTVRTHRKLRQSGVDAQLEVFDGLSHAEYMRDDTAPESKDAFTEIAGFFDKHLGK